jgi:hypothetical protein
LTGHPTQSKIKHNAFKREWVHKIGRNILPKMLAIQRIKTPSIQPNFVAVTDLEPSPPTASVGDVADCFCTYNDFFEKLLVN